MTDDRHGFWLWVSAAAGSVGGIWLGLTWSYQLLLLLMLLDVVSGLIAGGNEGDLSSSLSWKGMRKKAMSLLLVVSGAVIGTQVGLPAGEAVAGAIAVTEGISILENGERLGIKVPLLRDALDLVRRRSGGNGDRSS